MFKQKGCGMAEIYCIACGGPTYSRTIVTNKILFKKYLKNIITIEGNKEEIKEIINESNISNIDKKKLVKNLKIPKEHKKELVKSLKIPKEHKWLDKLLIITPKKIVKGVKSFGDSFVEKNNIKYYTPSTNNQDNEGYLMHIDCYNVLKKKYGDFKYNDIKLDNYYDLPKINYGSIKKYQEQWFYQNLAFSEKPELLESPLKNKKNKDRILKIKSFIKISKDKSISKKENLNRPSPKESATLFKENTKKKGNDGNIWIVNKNKNGIKRWKKLK